ncbi:MAG TPA: flavodoxin family protein [Planctomycetes bacterium]|nr:flavodoxin family protein [Planctomycetota bacterium]
MRKKIVAIIGSYRKGGITDTAASAVLAGAAKNGAQTQKIYLIDKHIEFCNNCRACTQQDTNGVRAACIHDDDMEDILGQIDKADGIVLASSVNFGTVTAIMKRFTERLVVYGYWPWGKPAPAYRISQTTKNAVIITSSAAPAIIGKFMFRSSRSVLKAAARCMGAKMVKSLHFGGVCLDADSQLSCKSLLKADKTGQKLASSI